ncbi:phosphatase PAP2 family protein [Jatrophihabitans sp. DSM 45814]
MTEDLPAGHAEPVQPQAARRFGRGVALAFVVALVAAVLFAALAALVATASAPVLRLDRNTANDFHNFAISHPGWTDAMKVISFIGSPLAWWVILGASFGWLLYRRLWWLAMFVAVGGIGSSLLNGLIKSLVDRTRPVLHDPVAMAAGKSFPSGHAQAAIVGYGILLMVFLPVLSKAWRPRAVVLAAVMVLAIGFSRIALGVHYFSDVIGAYLIGTVWLIGLIGAFRNAFQPSRPTSGGLTAGLAAELGDGARGLGQGLEHGLEPEQRRRLGQ